MMRGRVTWSVRGCSETPRSRLIAPVLLLLVGWLAIGKSLLFGPCVSRTMIAGRGGVVRMGTSQLTVSTQTGVFVRALESVRAAALPCVPKASSQWEFGSDILV